MEQPITPSGNSTQSFAPQYAPAAPVVSVGDWIITSLLMMIPLVNFILLFVWAFSNSTNPSKANWAKASLLIMAIFMVLGFVFFGAISAALMNANIR